MSSRRCIFSVPIACVSMALLEGCTIVYCVNEADNSSADHYVIPGEVGQLRYYEGEEILVITDSLRIIQGKIAGVEMMDSSAYEMRWQRWVEQSGMDLRPGDSIYVKTSPLLPNVSGRFRGISEGGIHVGRWGVDEVVDSGSVRELRADRGVWSGKDLEMIMADHPPPALMCLSIVAKDGGNVAIPVDEVRRGEYERSFDAWPLLFMVPVDIAFIVGVVSGLQKYRHFSL